MTVPGAISGYDALLKRFGTMTFKETFERAATIAEEAGVRPSGATPTCAVRLTACARMQTRGRSFSTAIACPTARIVRNPALAKALRLLQKEGRDAFYRGDIAAAIVRKIQDSGGVMKGRPRGSFSPSGSIRSQPPITVSTCSNCSTRAGIRRAAHAQHPRSVRPEARHEPDKAGSGKSRHLMVEAKKLAPDLYAHNGDPKFAKIPLNELLSKTYAAELCSKIDPNVA